jgi:hypothetical protein
VIVTNSAASLFHGIDLLDGVLITPPSRKSQFSARFLLIRTAGVLGACPLSEYSGLCPVARLEGRNLGTPRSAVTYERAFPEKIRG